MSEKTTAVREKRTPSSSLVLHNHVLTAADVDASGVLNAGFLLELVDKAAAIVSNRFSGLLGSCVTASMDSIAFLSPARLGDVIIIRGTVNRSWGSSMEVGLLIENENIGSGTRRFLSRAFLTMVGMSNGRPVAIPELVPQTAIERQRYDDAGRRREARLAEARVPPKTLQLNMESRVAPRVHPSPLQDTWMVEMVFPPDCNNTGNCFGGKILHWMLNCATLAASRYVRAPVVVAAAVDRVSFLTPIKNGDIVYLRSFVSRTFRTSIECYTSVAVLKLGKDENGKATQTLVPSNDGYSTFVARDSSQNMLRVPPLSTFRNEERELRWKGGEERRQLRLKQRHEMQEHARWREDEAEDLVDEQTSKPKL